MTNHENLFFNSFRSAKMSVGKIMKINSREKKVGLQYVRIVVLWSPMLHFPHSLQGRLMLTLLYITES